MLSVVFTAASRPKRSRNENKNWNFILILAAILKSLYSLPLAAKDIPVIV